MTVTVSISMAPWWKPYVLACMYAALFLRISPPEGHLERITKRAVRLTEVSQ